MLNTDQAVHWCSVLNMVNEADISDFDMWPRWVMAYSVLTVGPTY